MLKTIFQKLFWTSTAIILAVVTLISVSMLGLLNNYIVRERMHYSQRAAKSIEYLTTEVAMQTDDTRLKMAYNSTLASWSMILGADITVINMEKNVFAATDNTETVPDYVINSVLSGDTVNKFIRKQEKELSRNIIGIPITYHNLTLGGIFFFFPPNIMKSTVDEFAHIIFISLIIAIIIALILIYFSSRSVSRPLKEINDAVLEIASGKFDKRVSVYATDEISQLASSFNYMADSLEHLEEMRTGFISDISHELRTPMTSISGFVSGILDGTIPKERQNEYLELVLEESTRLVRLTNEMLEMTKMTSHGYKLSVKDFDLAEVTRLCIIGAEKEIDKKELELSVNFEQDSIHVLAEPDSIKRVIINLLDNAVKYSFENSKIDIKIFSQDEHIVFEISNIGTGIDEADLPYIFDRFYKSDKSRNRENGGAGLGLSFVKNILNLHSQQITVKSVQISNSAKKTTFSFTLEKA